MSITITEALAEIKTIAARIQKKRDTIRGHLARIEGIRDPLEKTGGSAKMITEESQAVVDLEKRLIELRRGISKANDTTVVTIFGTALTISEWLTWRRDIAPGERLFLSQLQGELNNIRHQARSKGASVVSASVSTGDTQPTDIVVNIDERELSKEIEKLEDILGQLDGQLSLKNATTTI